MSDWLDINFIDIKMGNINLSRTRKICICKALLSIVALHYIYIGGFNDFK